MDDTTFKSMKMMPRTCILEYLWVALAISFAAAARLPSVEAAAYDEDHRQTEEDYAVSHSVDLQELKDSIAATGGIECGGYRATAQLTLTSDTITTAAHQFIDTKTCRLRSKVAACVFAYTWKGVSQRVQLSASFFRSGLTCPKDSNHGDDWAVAKLAHPAKGPTPYKIDEYKTRGVLTGEKLLVVETLSIDVCLRNGTTGKCLPDRRFGGFLSQRTVQDCALRSEEHQDGFLFLTDCAGSSGASGSGILSQQDHMLLGVRYSDSMSKAEIARESATGRPVIKPYDRQDWSAAEVPVAGDFAKAIMEAAGHTGREDPRSSTH